MNKVLLIGTSARAAAIAEMLTEGSATPVLLYCISGIRNPDLWRLSHGRLLVGDVTDLELVRRAAKQVRPDFAIIGPEAPLAAGVADELAIMGIPCFGPTRELAQLESSKRFARELLDRNNIPGNPEFAVFEGMDGVPEYLASLGEFVVKPNGLTGGKGVKVSGDHLASVDEGAAYAQEVLAAHSCVVIEEKMEGEEFSLQSVFDGRHLVDTIPVQDHKRSKEYDLGPNTGGMGSYSCADHSLPFLTADDIAQASAINGAVACALSCSFETPFKGVLYGGFMATADGVRLVEYNVRFGDPEVFNVLSLLKTDLVRALEAVFNQTLGKEHLSFRPAATVCKYVVPQGYPENPEKGEAIQSIPASRDNMRAYCGSVDLERGTNRWLLGGSRAIAFTGIGSTLDEAEAIAEEAACQVEGPVRHRMDIGTQESVTVRVAHMCVLRG
ncbi:MAG: phosphoribosylamine--glycine ligase [Patescibacteria group bacterium]|nr:phosphoribosylamine--glycine ligase [Patescibacteria group bacterium]